MIYSAIAVPHLMFQGSKVQESVALMVKEQMAGLWEQWQYAATPSTAGSDSPRNRATMPAGCHFKQCV